MNIKNIPEIKLTPTPETAEAREAIGYRWNDEACKRHKLGRQPDWIQQPEAPVCEVCKQPMTFYGQLDSIGDDYDLADCGMIYVFVCFDCFTTQGVLQSY
jgi:hypothetical protein